jgi:hypothetical protein
MPARREACSTAILVQASINNALSGGYGRQ